MSLADAMAKSPETFSARLCRDGGGRRGGRISRRGAGANRRFPVARKGTEIEGADGDDLSVHSALSRAGGADGAAGVFHSEIPKGLRQRSRGVAVDHPAHHRRQPSWCVPTDCSSRWAWWASVFLVRTWFASEKGRRVWEGMVLRAPLVGPLVAQFAMARFCRMLGHAARRRRAAGAGLECRAQIHRQPDSRGRRLANPSSACSRAAGSVKASRSARILFPAPFWK